MYDNTPTINGNVPQIQPFSEILSGYVTGFTDIGANDIVNSCSTPKQCSP